MNIEQLRKELELDEGVKKNDKGNHISYFCSQNVVTGGIGHMITEWDDEKYLEVGVEIPDEQVKAWFDKDIETVLSDCELLYDDFDHLPEDAQLIIANMMFNLGYPRLKKFVGMKAGVDARDWNKAADEMIDSNYYKQLPNRAGRLVKRMRSLHGSI
ncbi:glycoside hydrolase family protein [Alphaproteobacteria bacterium]|nr:glycoside hydrolase family protein [Alphaproteobacteria bacterium]